MSIGTRAMTATGTIAAEESSGFLRELMVPHSQDSADKIDSALEANEQGMRCLKISFVGLMITAITQTAIVSYTNSVALLGDTLHNYADALTALPIAIAFTRVATRAYTYGYGRAEDLAGSSSWSSSPSQRSTLATRRSSGS